MSDWNLERLKKLVINGPNTYPGANYIIRPDGVKIRLDYVSDRKIIADSLATSLYGRKASIGWRYCNF